MWIFKEKLINCKKDTRSTKKAIHRTISDHFLYQIAEKDNATPTFGFSAILKELGASRKSERHL